MCILTALAVILLILCCCGICFCAPPCICAVWLEKRRRRRNKDKKTLAFVTERQVNEIYRNFSNRRIASSIFASQGLSEGSSFGIIVIKPKSSPRTLWVSKRNRKTLESDWTPSTSLGKSMKNPKIFNRSSAAKLERLSSLSESLWDVPESKW